MRTGRGFGAYHAVTGFAALPAAVMFGALYQLMGAGTAFWFSAAAMAVAVAAWVGLTGELRSQRQEL